MNEQGIFSKMFSYLFGANWATSLSGIIAFVSALVHNKPEIIGWIPEPFRSIIWAASEYTLYGSIAAIGITSKAKNVTGGSVQQTLTGAPAPEGSQTLVDVTKASTPSETSTPTAEPPLKPKT